MKLFLVACLLATCLASPVDEWRQFKKQYNKDYTNGDDEEKRMNIFFSHKKLIDEHNAKFERGQETFSLKMNQFGDLSPHEFRAIYNGFNRSNIPTNGGPTRGGRYVPPVGEELPDSKDWRTEGAVTPVKNQGTCGSCWSFSATGSLEGQTFIKTGKLVSLSEQNLVDCSADEGNQGCYGGLMDQAFQYVQKSGGLDTEESYPYEGKDGRCRFNPENVGATNTGFQDIDSGNEAALQSAIANVGPIAVAIDASSLLFQFYFGGVYYNSGCSSTELDHGVLAVGYGSENGQDYWLVKNSWGSTWGLSGYVKMARNKDNHCGIATQASYPTV